MEARAKNLENIFGNLKKIIIPIYQRNYSWEKSVAKQLFDDLLDLMYVDNEHFIGPIVSIIHNREESCRILIDGQQRLTTILILLCALRNLVKYDKIEVTNKNFFIEEIEEDFLINKRSENKDERIRLKPYNKDAEKFKSLFDESFAENDTNKIIVNYLYFKDLIEREFIDNNLNIDIFFKKIKTKINFVDIMLFADQNKNSQNIFESLNSKGQDLTNADLIRNLILMDKSENEQDKLYRDYWEKIENNVKKHDKLMIEDFIRDYLIYQNPSDVAKLSISGDIYKRFKYFFNNNDNNINDILQDLLRFSIYYNNILNSTHSNKEIQIELEKIDKLEIGVSYPFLLYVFELNYQNIISNEDILNTLKLIQNYIFRRFFVEGAPTNVLNKVFYYLKNSLNNYIDELKDNYFEILKYILLKKEGSSRFPNDKDFKNGLIIKDVYSFKFKNKLFLFENLEKYNNKKEYLDFEDKIKSKELSIEHIMPQTLTESWKKELGLDYKEIHETFLNKLGNLTITCYNSELSNKSFKEKREKYKESNISITRDILEFDVFNQDNIKKRSDNLSDIALKIWEYPKTNYKTQKDIQEYFSIYDSKNFTGKKLSSFTFLGKEYENIASWRKLLEKILNIFIDLDIDKLISFVKNNNSYCLSNKEDINYKIFNEQYQIYIYKQMSTDTIFNVIQKLFEYFNFKEEDLNIEIKNI